MLKAIIWLNLQCSKKTLLMIKAVMIIMRLEAIIVLWLRWQREATLGEEEEGGGRGGGEEEGEHCLNQ